MSGWTSRPIGALVERLERAGQLERVTTKVSPLLEISEITHRISKEKGPALLFENVEGSDIPLLINLFGSRERIELGLGRPIDDLFLDVAARFISHREYQSDLAPVIVPDDGQWHVLDSLFRLPIMQGWSGDGGRYITLPLVYTRDPESGAVNCGIYRMQVLDNRTTCIHWQSHSDGFHNYELHRVHGRRMEVAVAIGCEPAHILAAAMGIPRDLSEITLAGLFQGQRVSLMRGCVVDMPVPSSAEIVLEGTVDPNEFHAEGPFGDYTGYYSTDDKAAVFHIESIRCRPHPLYVSTLIGKPTLEFIEMVKFMQAVKMATRKAKDSDIVDYWAPPEGGLTNFGFVAVRKRYPGHAKDVIRALWNEKQRPSRVKILVAFDEDVNVRELGEALWQFGSNIDPVRDVFFGEGRLDDLNHSSPQKGWGSKMGIDATSKWPEEGHPMEWPRKISMTPDVRGLVTRRWAEYFSAEFRDKGNKQAKSGR